MGTSNWQNIPYNIEVLRKIAPQRVLDVGVGFGRWGILTREFCDVWEGRVLKQDWSIYIEGIEAFKDNISSYHEAFYDHIYFGDAREIIPGLNGPWDVVIFGDVLEHFERETAETLLKHCLERSAYVMINIPLGSDWPQDASYQNIYEKHLSVWEESDFDRLNLVHKARFLDFRGRPYAVFVLSTSDPKNLKETVFSTALAWTIWNSQDNIYLQALLVRNKQYIEELNRINRYLEEIKNTRGYRTLEFFRESPIGNWWLKFRRNVVPRPSMIPDPQRSAVPEPQSDELPPPEIGATHPRQTNAGFAWSADDQVWLDRQTSRSCPLSINHPEWRGILASARELYEEIYLLPDTLDEQNSLYYAELFRSARPPSITIQGFPTTYYHLVKALHKTAPDLPIYVIWHGNFLHSKEDLSWESFNLVKALSEEGAIKKVGFVKMGMAEVMKTTGMPAYFVMNLVRRIPTQASQPLLGGPHVGIWAEPDYGWKKLPYVMLASLSLMPELAAHVVNVSARARTFGEWLHLQADYHTEALNHNQVIEMLPKMHLNMYVTLTECAPMLPLESLSLGAACLFGPTTHYFLDNDFLHRRLVVPYPDSPEVIARQASQAIQERAEIIQVYQAYAPEYNQRAFQMLSEFLEYPMGPRSG